MTLPISTLHKRPRLFSKKEKHTLDQTSSATWSTRKKKSRNYRGRKVLLPKKGNCWKLRTIDDDFSIELSIPHTTHWGYYTKKKAFFLFEESSKSMHKNHLFYPDTFGWQHTRKKYLKTSKSQRGFFFFSCRSQKERIGIQGQKVTTERFKIIHRNTNFVGLRVGISSSKSMAIIEAHKAKSPTATLRESTKIDSKRFQKRVIACLDLSGSLVVVLSMLRKVLAHWNKPEVGRDWFQTSQ